MTEKLPTICKHCNFDISQRNPSGYCDHLHYPEGCSVCSREPTTIEIAEWESEFDKEFWGTYPIGSEYVWEKVKRFIKQVGKDSSLALLREVSEQVLGADDRFDELEDADKKEYSAQDMELIAVHMRNKLRAEQRKALDSLVKKYGNG